MTEDGEETLDFGDVLFERDANSTPNVVFSNGLTRRESEKNLLLEGSDCGESGRESREGEESCDDGTKGGIGSDEGGDESEKGFSR